MVFFETLDAGFFLIFFLVTFFLAIATILRADYARKFMRIGRLRKSRSGIRLSYAPMPHSSMVTGSPGSGGCQATAPIRRSFS